MIAVIDRAPAQLDRFEAGAYVAPTWAAGLERRGVVVGLELRGKRNPETIVIVKWLVGRTEELGTTSKINTRKLRLVWQPQVKDVVRLKDKRRCQITKIHGDGALQLQPEHGQSFKAGVRANAS